MTVVVLVKDGRCWEVLKKEGDLVDYVDVAGGAACNSPTDATYVIRDSHAFLLEQGYTAGLAQRATKANGQVMHFLLDAAQKVTSIFVDGVVVPPVTGRRYAGRA